MTLWLFFLITLKNVVKNRDKPLFMVISLHLEKDKNLHFYASVCRFLFIGPKNDFYLYIFRETTNSNNSPHWEKRLDHPRVRESQVLVPIICYIFLLYQKMWPKMMNIWFSFAFTHLSCIFGHIFPFRKLIGPFFSKKLLFLAIFLKIK